MITVTEVLLLLLVIIIIVIILNMITLTILDSEFRCYAYTEEDYTSLLSYQDYQTNRVKVIMFMKMMIRIELMVVMLMLMIMIFDISMKLSNVKLIYHCDDENDNEDIGKEIVVMIMIVI